MIRRKIINALKLTGVDLNQMKTFVSGVIPYLKDLYTFNKKVKKENGMNRKRLTLKPMLGDKRASAGSIEGHYFLQDLYVSRRVINNSPNKHVDIGSRIDGFVANVASSMRLEVFDVRPINMEIENVRFRKIDIVNDINKIDKGYCGSVSCLHTLEHIGLGRYGDKIDVNGHIKGLNSIKKICEKGGKIYISTPFGPGRVEFNAQRVFSLKYLFRILDERFTIEKFSYIDENSKIHKDIDLDQVDLDGNIGCKYGCGIFEMSNR